MAKKPRVKVPKSAKKGDVIQVKTLFSHKMETGLRKDKKTGKLIPRKIINKFECLFNGKEVFSADIHPAVAANPYFAFSCRAEETGEFTFKWTEDGGKVISASRKMKVS